jgi:streptogramin lyase
MHSGILGEIDTSTNTITERHVILPGTGANTTPTLAGLAVASDGSIWLSYSGSNSLLRYQPGEAHYTLVHLDQANSNPSALTSDPQGRLWFTTGGTASAIGQINIINNNKQES